MRNATRMSNLQRVQFREGIITEPSPNLSRRDTRLKWLRGETREKKESANTRTRARACAYACSPFPECDPLWCTSFFTHLEHSICARLEMAF